MDKYKTRPGVILTEICGEYLLVSAKEAGANCPYVTQINETSAFLWEHMADWTDIEKLMEETENEYKIEDFEEARQAIRGFLTQMTGLGYLLKEE